jgi:hypothetical protein
LAVLLPNGTVYNPGGLSGAATAHAALSDSSNTSYVEHAPEWQPGIFEVGTYTKTAGSVVKHVRAIVKASSISVNPVKIRWGFQLGGVNYGETSNLQIAGTTPTVYNGPWVNVGDLAQASIDALRVYVDAQPLWTSARFYEASVEVLEASPPTTAVTGPTGALSASGINVTWTHTPGTEGGAQTAYQVRIFTSGQYDAPGFDPSTSAAYFDSGVVALGTDLHFLYVGAGTYRAYVRTAQSINGTSQWAAWDYEPFTVSLTEAEVLEVTAAGDGTIGAVEIIIDRDTGQDAWDHIELERSVDVSEQAALGVDGGFDSGYGGLSFITGITAAQVPAKFDISNGGGTDPTALTSVIQNTPSPWNGNYWLIGGTFDQDDRLTVAAGVYPFDVTPGDTVTVEAMAHSGLGANCVMRMGLAFYDAGGGVIPGAETEFPSHSAWKAYAHSMTVPAGARQATGTISIFGKTGASGAVCALAIDNWRMSKSVEWVAVPGADEITPGADQVTILDHLAPPDTAIRYRARAVKADGTLGDWVHSNTTVEWTSTDWFLKHPTDPSKTVSIGCLVTRPTLEQERPTGVFVIAGSNTPMVLYDELQDPTGELVFETETVADKDDLIALLTATGIVAAHFPEVYDIPNMWVSIPRFRPEFDSQVIEHYRRVWTLPFIETREP